ncbi:MAG TPA: prohibitin family protein [Fimbriimonadaceae bacterium]|nr:prohibitin family protein [Fimbriimonadaceae bacterium]
MFLVVLGIILLVVALVMPKGQAAAESPRVRFGLSLTGGILVVVGLVTASFIAVPAGFRGVLLTFGAVHGDLSEGPHLIVPGIQTVVLMEVRTLKNTADASAASRDLQTVQTKVAINFHVDPSKVGKLYQSVGTDFASRIIDPATQETVKAVVANYTAEELINQRGRVKQQIDEALTQRLAAYDLMIEPGGVSLTNFDFSTEFNHAIELKQVAQQTAEQQKYELQKAQLAAETEVAAAKGRAQAAQLEAAALNAMGGSKVLAKAWIEKWDGKLPTVSGSQGMIIDIQSLMNQQGGGSTPSAPPAARRVR